MINDYKLLHIKSELEGRWKRTGPNCPQTRMEIRLSQRSVLLTKTRKYFLSSFLNHNTKTKSEHCIEI